MFRTFIFNGDYWEVGFEGKTISVKDADGIRYITYLLESPHKHFRPIELYGLVKGTTPNFIENDPSKKSNEQIISESSKVSLHENEGLATSDLNFRDLDKEDLDDILKKTKKEYHQYREANPDAAFEDWKNVIQPTLDIYDIECSEDGDNLILKHKPQRNRQAENARINVSKRIKKTLPEIKRVHPALGAYLEKRVRTGRTIRFIPTEPDYLWTIRR
jgi:hypothetical protein